MTCKPLFNVKLMFYTAVKMYKNHFFCKFKMRFRTIGGNSDYSPPAFLKSAEIVSEITRLSRASRSAITRVKIQNYPFSRRKDFCKFEFLPIRYFRFEVRCLPSNH